MSELKNETKNFDVLDRIMQAKRYSLGEYKFYDYNQRLYDAMTKELSESQQRIIPNVFVRTFHQYNKKFRNGFYNPREISINLSEDQLKLYDEIPSCVKARKYSDELYKEQCRCEIENTLNKIAEYYDVDYVKLGDSKKSLIFGLNKWEKTENFLFRKDKNF